MLKVCTFLALLCATLVSTTFADAQPLAESLLKSAKEAAGNGDRDQALKLVSQSIETDPKNSEAYAFRAVIFDSRRQFALAVADHTKVIELSANPGVAYQRRGEDNFRLGRFKESVADFDKTIELDPSAAPFHWQRGISLYYAGEFDRGAKQFELHKTVNPEDVENAVWHFLCVARLSGVEKARKSLFPIHDDGRVPMMQVHALFAGKMTPEAVLETAKAGNPGEAELHGRLFYAYLYLGLYDEASGNLKAAKEHIALAEKYAGADYMGDVARVHAAVVKISGDSK